jgi:hypothetical protein
MWLRNVNYQWTNIQNPAEWATAIATGNVIVIPYTSGELQETAKTEDGFGDLAEMFVTYEITAEIDLPFNPNNDAFWNEKKNSLKWVVGYVTQNHMMELSVPAMLVPTHPVIKDKETMLRDHVQVKAVQSFYMQRLPRVANIFNDCSMT